MLLKALALLALTTPSAGSSAVLHPISAGFLSAYPDGSIAGPDVPPYAGDAPRMFAGRAAVGANPLIASEARAVFKFDVSSVPEVDDLKITIKNWGSESAPGLVSGCFRISICPPLSSYSLFAGAGLRREITPLDFSIGRTLNEASTSPGTIDSTSLSPWIADFGHPSVLTLVVAPTSEGGSFFEAHLFNEEAPSPVPIPAGWLMLLSALSGAALWNGLRQAKRG